MHSIKNIKGIHSYQHEYLIPFFMHFTILIQKHKAFYLPQDNEMNIDWQTKTTKTQSFLTIQGLQQS